MKTNALVQSA